MKIQHYILLFSVSFMLFSCAKKVDVTNMVSGIWETDWSDELDGDVDEIAINEIIAFNEDGSFQQVFSGEAQYDDFFNETEVEYLIAIKGIWKVVDKNKIVLRYDMNELDVLVGKSNIEEDYTDAAIGLLTGNWVDFVAGAIKGSQTDKLNKQVEEETTKEITKFFKDMFRKMNTDQKAFTDVKIKEGTLTAKVNHGFWGRDAVYDSKNEFKTTKPSISNSDTNAPKASKVPKATKSQPKSQSKTSSTPKIDDSMVEFKGSIGKYPIIMYLNLDNIDNYDRCPIEGMYRYTTSGSGSYLNVSGIKREQNLQLTEHDENGNLTGTFKGTFTIFGSLASFEYTGTFTNSKGKEFNFSLSSN